MPAEMEEQKKSISFDDLFPHIGGGGVFQVTLFFILACVGIFSEEVIYSNFFGASMDHWCYVPDLMNYSMEVQKTVAIPSEKENTQTLKSLDYCNMFNFNYSLYTHDDFLNWNRSVWLAETKPIDKVRCKYGWVYDRSEFTKTIVSKYDLVCGQEFKVSLGSTIYIGGMLLGGFSSGAVADIIGRKPTMLVTIVIKTLGSVLAALAPTYAIMMVGRFVTGFGSSGFYLTAFVIMMEVSSPLSRSVMGIGHMITFSVGYMIVPGVAFFIRDYQKLLIVMAAPNLIGIFYIWFVPESPRWLLTKGKVEKARKIIEYIASTNRKKVPDWLDMSQIKAVDEDLENVPKRNVLDLFKSPTIRKWTLIVYLHWFTDSLVYFALSLNASTLAGDVFLNTFLLGLVEVPANIICVFAMEYKRLGRRGTACISLLVAGGASLLSIPLVTTGALPALATTLAMLGKAGGTMGFSVIFVYTSEIFPTEVRNVAMGSSAMSARLSGMVAAFVGKEMGKAWKALPFLIYGAFGLLSGGLILLLPETLNLPLKQTIEEAEAKQCKKRQNQTLCLLQNKIEIVDLNKQ